MRERTRIGDYLRWLARDRGRHFADYDALWRWSVTELEAFWQSLWDYFAVIAHTPPKAVLTSRRRPHVLLWLPPRPRQVGAVPYIQINSKH